jgi:hypothetical protein
MSEPTMTVTDCSCGSDDAVTWRKDGWEYLRCHGCNVLASHWVGDAAPPASAETERLRRRVAAVEAERDAARDALRLCAAAITAAEYEPENYVDWGALRDARAAARAALAAEESR